MTSWLAANGTAAGRPVFVTCGALEYFTEAELRELLGVVRSSGAALALAEPVSMDLAHDLASRPRGSLVFSHNYPHLVAASGLQILAQEVIPIDAAVPFHNHVNLIAVAPA